LDLSESGLKETPNRVAAMYVKEIFSGLNPSNKPQITLFENKYHYSEIIVEKNITLHSYCEHYFIPFTAKAHIAYICKGKTIGSGQLNKLLQYHSRKPQSKEMLIEEIALSVKDCLASQDVAVIIEAFHCCGTPSAINTGNNSTVTAHFSGKFQNEDTKREFFSYLK
ncbi:MAG: GTP cyclohydrolase I, partial [Chitinophagaceae bacterium]